MKTTKVILIWSMVIGFLAQGFGQMPTKIIEVFEDGSVKIERDSLPLNIYIHNPRKAL